VVLLACHDDTVRAGPALAELCRIYWYPLYAYARRLGQSAEDAQDMTQEFFARLIEKQWLNHADPDRGRFRSFLLSSFKHFLASEWHKARAVKRGGGEPPLSLDGLEAEARYALEPADTATPEAIYDRRWALTVLDQALTRLEAEQGSAGRAAQFEAVKDCLLGDPGDATLAELGARVGQSEAAMKSIVRRMRERYRALLREEIAQTVDGPESVDEELRSLLAALRR
jgi:RNA polymerase sigma-70 factor (ECF subfamily)